MWKEVLSFAQRPCAERNLIHGVLVEVDPMISAVQVYVLSTGVIITGAIGHDEDRSVHLRDIVKNGQDAVRIECYVSPSTRNVVRLVLSVVEERLNEHMSLGRLCAEVHMIALVMEVWREACVPTPEPMSLAMEDLICRACNGWYEQYPPFPHQHASVAWMRALERGVPRTIRYAGNIAVTNKWYIDTEGECFTTDPSWRTAEQIGGVCCDGTGTGKTATALRHIVLSREDGHILHPPEDGTLYFSKGTLVILPLNLVSQWQSELLKFVSANLNILWLVQGKDIRGLTMAHLCEADIVFTTFHFLRASKPYNELVECVVGSTRQRSRALLTAWARTPNRHQPILEAVYWNRVIVDELHYAFQSTRDLRHLKLLNTRMWWGLTATPDCNTEQAQHLYLLLRREKAHHPNLLARLIAEGVRGTSSKLVHPKPSLHLVQLSEDERTHLNTLTADQASVEDVIKMCTMIDAFDTDRVGDADTIQQSFLQTRSNEITALRAKVIWHRRAVEILERATVELENEICDLAGRCAMGDELATAQAEAAQAAAEAHARDLNHARQLRDTEVAKLSRQEAASRLVTQQLALLRERGETCSICMDRDCVAITPCAHLFCSTCVKQHVERVSSTCPTCRAPLRFQDLTGIVSRTAVGSKMAKIGELIRSLGEEPIILFVQWKTMVRGMRAYLRGINVRTMLLDGNTSQRATTLNHFIRGGVLLLCMQDSFAGLHLPHARHVVFAHAIVGDRASVLHLERQAIARCVRHGQTGEVRVYSFVVADCEEERLWRHTHDDMIVD